jgi:hypothetical protein
MGVKYSISLANIKVNLFIPLLLFIVISLIPSSNFAQATKETETAVDCSIPKKISKVRPHQNGVPTEVKIGIVFIDIKATSDAD